MPKLIIDNREIEVPKGTKIIEAAEQLGIMIPRFCYHRALGAVGACRVCAVKFVEGPFKGVQMSCMIDAKDGMIVSTTDEETVEFRKYVIEWLMLHHPHDCPVCDEGGHCVLQDMTVSGGHGIRRYQGKKRTYHDQYLGPLLQHEMNRCIQCYRCSRFYQEFAGYRDLGVMQIGFHVYFGRQKDGILESPFAGNVSDLCPTGVFTDKPSRYIGRRWDYERSPSLCINCSLGCHTISSVRYREVVRLEARYSEAVNGHFICDRGRYGFFYASDPERPRRALAAGAEIAYDQAVVAAARQLDEISQKYGPQAIACIGSARNNLETQAMLARVCRLKGWSGPVYFADRATAHKVETAASRLETRVTVSLREVERADCIIALGVDPINEAPMLALAMRQAQRHGAEVFVLDPRPIFLPLKFQHLPVGLDELNFVWAQLVRGAVERDRVEKLGQQALQFYEELSGPEQLESLLREKVSAAIEQLRGSENSVIICGTEVVRPTTPALAADSVLLVQAMGKRAGLFYVMPGPNVFGAALLKDDDNSLAQTIEDIEKGKIKGLLVVDSDPFSFVSDRQRLHQAITKLELLVVLDHVSSTPLKRADIFLPTQSLYETGGTFINQEGRLQAVSRSYRGGAPISQVGGGDHPPRLYGAGLPGSEPKDAWQILAELANTDELKIESTTRVDLWKWLAEFKPVFANIPPLDQLPADGFRLSSGQETVSCFSLDWKNVPEKKEGPGDALELILVEWTFGTEELSVISPHLRKVERNPCLFMQVGDARTRGLSEGDRVALKLDKGTVEVDLCLAENMAAGVVVLPRHHRIEWQKLEAVPAMVRPEQIEKVSTF